MLENKKMPQFIDGEAFKSLIPQKGKMSLIDRVIKHKSSIHSITCEADIKKDCLFFDEAHNGVPSWVGFEYMAQSVAAVASLDNLENKCSENVNQGVILSVSNYKSSVAVFELGTTVTIDLKEDYYSDNIYRYDGTIFNEKGDVIVKAKLTVMETQSVSDIG